jgi:hypothetical protein
VRPFGRPGSEILYQAASPFAFFLTSSARMIRRRKSGSNSVSLVTIGAVRIGFDLTAIFVHSM